MSSKEMTRNKAKQPPAKCGNAAPNAPQPEPRIPTPPAPGETARVIPFWEKASAGNEHPADCKTGKGSSQPAPAAPPAAGTAPQPTTSEGNLGDPYRQRERPPPVTRASSTSPNVHWEEAGQYALNSSILTGRFEDLRLVAFTKRLRTRREVSAPLSLYANTAILTKAFPNVASLLAQCVYGLDGNLDDDLVSSGEVPLSTPEYEHYEDSDLEDTEDEIDVQQRATPRNPRSRTYKEPPPTKVQSNQMPPTATSVETAKPIERKYQARVEDIGEPPNNLKAETAATDYKPERTPSPSIKTEEFQSVASSITTDQEDGPPRSAVRESVAPSPVRDAPLVRVLRTVAVTDTAYRTWRAFIFYAYTRRIAFAPLRSQNLGFRPVDDPDDGSQLPVCSPKSMYRLALKYGDAELQALARNDIASKLSTQNVLDEVFSTFASRYTEIQDMELDFALAHLKHPDIVVRLPTWIHRFARGELKECADTFGRLIHKLACATTMPVPLGTAVCPRGCAMPTIQHRCSMCGITFN